MRYASYCDIDTATCSVFACVLHIHIFHSDWVVFDVSVWVHDLCVAHLRVHCESNSALSSNSDATAD